ncbi:MAG: tetratricopeptide repeat protein [Candidatus Korobacteraceae bacterium]|jgi:TPR repeat protein
MFDPANLGFRQAKRKWLLALAVLVGTLATWGCTRSNASASAPQAAVGQQSPRVPSPTSDTRPTQAQTTQSPAGLSLELADTFREAQSGNPQAMAKLANAYETGEGAPQDFQLAISWFTRAAEAGDSLAMYRLGRIYAAGSGVPKDYKEAARWYEKAATAGNADAMYSLGRAYETGSGVREDVQEAVRWYDAAELRGNKEAKAAAERLGESIEDH